MVSRGESAVDRLGILGLDVTGDLAKLLPWLREKSGVIVAALTPQPAWSEGGGLRPGDVIQSANGKPVGALAALRTLVAALPAGGTLVLHVDREGTRRYVTLELE
jgi:S1-C subfamily serine protease